MAKPYNSIPLTSPSWLVKRIGEQGYREFFSGHTPGTLLDIGCGGGEKRTVIPQSIKYTGADHLSTVHRQTNIDVFCDAYSLPFKENSYEMVFCTGVLEHLEEPQKAVHEAHRVLVPCGFALYTIPLFWHLHEEPRDFYRYTEYGIRYLFERAGFDIIEIKPLSGFWITFGTEFNYYINALPGRQLKYIKKAWIAMNNLMFIGLEKLEKKLMSKSVRWTWMYQVVARK